MICYQPRNMLPTIVHKNIGKIRYFNHFIEQVKIQVSSTTFQDLFPCSNESILDSLTIFKTSYFHIIYAYHVSCHKNKHRYKYVTPGNANYEKHLFR